MKKKALLVVALLLALSITMAAMAYSTAVISSPASLKIATTDTALLALKPGTGLGNMDGTAYVINKGGYDGSFDGRLAIDFGKNASGMVGLQPGSIYYWNSLFTIENKSADAIKVKLYWGSTDAAKFTQLIAFGKTMYGNTVKDFTNGVVIAAGGSVDVAATVTLSGYDARQGLNQLFKNANLVVDAEAVN